VAIRRRLQVEAAEVVAALDLIPRIVRERLTAQTQQYAVPLTPPQLLAIEQVVDEQRSTGHGLSLSELSSRMGLTHSTVSGIVDRLERRGLLSRAQRAEDRRFIEIQVTAPVEQWLSENLPESRAQPILDVLIGASPA
jgi:MarR family transcriptional regulator, organic hydroperoxide resistance regulator